MSAYMLDRSCFLAIGAFVAAHTNPGVSHGRLWAYLPDRPYELNRYTPERAASVLIQQNRASVNARYEDTARVRNITAAELHGVPAPTPGELGGILRSLAYQSSETEDWRTCEAREVIHALRELALKVVTEAEGARDWA